MLFFGLPQCWMEQKNKAVFMSEYLQNRDMLFSFGAKYLQNSSNIQHISIKFVSAIGVDIYLFFT